MQDLDARITMLEERVDTLESTIAMLMQFFSMEGNNLAIGNKAGRLELKAEEVSIDTAGDISVTSKADVKIRGLTIDNNADAGFTAKGSATAELSSGGETTIRGAMVMIN
ncbi:MAG: hypothetical protein PHD01_07135 [Geobacteraceae bacterium]|nr:hypothetical protein [Geobacteraceae bacterium]